MCLCTTLFFALRLTFGVEQVSVPLADGREDLHDMHLRFQIMLRQGDDDSSVNIAWHYPPGNPRDNSAWVGLYAATRCVCVSCTRV